ncbi:MAG TPA: acyclic terpene utilization AtuA family protein [Bryobacteraceae bacterium]|nr:acyclic terpene utilization AtuA family protein [Bryobacteraceae bacterium]
MIRVANGQGFWGDWVEAPLRLLRGGPIDFLTLDYLAEVTMAVLQKQRMKQPAGGYAHDFPLLIQRLAPELIQRGVAVVANAGGLNPAGCASEVKRLTPNLKVAAVMGDDILSRLDEIQAQGCELANMDTGQPLSEVRDKVLSANVYLGAFPIAEALSTRAQVVVTGRCADAALAMGPVIHRFGWQADDWNRLAAGVTAGHIIECGAQVTGGNYGGAWQEIEDLDEIGYPIAEMELSGEFVITKHKGSGGRVTAQGVKEQLLYEVGDPRAYITPDCIADFTSLNLADCGPDRVHITGAHGRSRPEQLKVSINYAAGWKATGTLVYSAPNALEKARTSDRIVRKRLARLGLAFDEIRTEYFGVNACHGENAPPMTEAAEVQLRIGVRGQHRNAVERFTQEMIPLVLSGPPGATGYGDGRPKVREVVANWNALLPRDLVMPRVEVIE